MQRFGTVDASGDLQRAGDQSRRGAGRQASGRYRFAKELNASGKVCNGEAIARPNTADIHGRPYADV